MPSRFSGGIVEYHAFKRSRTLTAAEPITGGQCVTMEGTDRTVAVAGAGDNFDGVALHDADTGEKLTVVLDGELPLIASGNIEAGDVVVTAANGAVATDNSPDPIAMVGRATADEVSSTVRVEVNA